MQQYLGGADLYEFYVDEVLKPIDVGVGAHTTLRTSDNNWQGQAFGGYGMWLIPDDVAKITDLLNVNDGAVGGTQLLESDQLAAAMQRDPADRGLVTSSPSHPFRYNNGFWARDFTTGEGYPCDFWVPFMSGYGGISVAMMPGGATYWYFSDNGEYDWKDVVAEVQANIADNCVGGPPPTGGALHVDSIDVNVVPAGGPWHRAETTVTIVDENQVPVSGVTVDATYSGATSSSPNGVTGTNGQVTLTSGKKKHGGTWTLCVDVASLGGWTYDAGANNETCDSGSG